MLVLHKLEDVGQDLAQSELALCALFTHLRERGATVRVGLLHERCGGAPLRLLATILRLATATPLPAFGLGGVGCSPNTARLSLVLPLARRPGLLHWHGCLRRSHHPGVRDHRHGSVHAALRQSGSTTHGIHAPSPWVRVHSSHVGRRRVHAAIRRCGGTPIHAVGRCGSVAPVGHMMGVDRSRRRRLRCRLPMLRRASHRGPTTALGSDLRRRVGLGREAAERDLHG
mmetsp:Transcript_117506/g.262641  ORF Transcript_117506/g.262641 Transcript_117506/m.262641 type:complete len:228 (+) Transcript_117506:1028-1711(+)